MAIKNKKGSGHTEELSKELMAQLNCDTAFTIPLFGGIPVAESVVVTWVIMAVLLIAAAILGRNLKVENVGKKQLVLETIVGGLYNFFYDLLGEEGKQYIPYLMTVGVYIGFANMIGLFGLKSPTKDVGVTGALALMSIILIEAAGVRKKGTKGFLKSFAEPIPIMLPMNILEVFIRPLSLCMRLFGNILGAFVIMELIKIVVPIFVPAGPDAGRGRGLCPCGRGTACGCRAVRRTGRVRFKPRCIEHYTHSFGRIDPAVPRGP